MKPLNLALFAAFALSACASFGTFAGQDTGDVQFAADAEENMKRGNDAMDARNFNEAAAYFDFVKTKFPYLELARTAELRLGDADFERDKFLEARDRYQSFVRLHPTHQKIDYAAYRAAMTHYKDMPSDFFILPPSSEKDQNEVRAASVALADFIRTYPTSEHVPLAQKNLDEVRRRMAEHELYVAGFYKRREKWPAVVSRLSVVAKDFGGLGYEEKVYFGLYDAYRKMNEEEKAKEALQTLVAKYPDTDAAKKAQRVLEK